MGVTEFTNKQTRHLTPVVILGGSFVIGNLSIFLVSNLEKMQAKSHNPGGVDMFDFAMLIAGMLGSIALSITAFMNRTYGKYQDDKEERQKIETAFLIKEAEAGRLKKAEPDTAPPQPEKLKNLG